MKEYSSFAGAILTFAELKINLKLISQIRRKVNI
jgi:hypothetical protein